MSALGYVLLVASMLVACIGGGILVGLHRPGWWVVNAAVAVLLWVAAVACLVTAA